MKKIFILLPAMAFVACTNRKWEEIKPKAVTAQVICDTSYTVSFSAHIQPILTSSCGAADNGCHTTATANSGGSASVSLDNYTGVQDVFSTGQLKGCLTGDVNYTQMPKSPYELSECHKKDIMRWINAGAPNN